MRRAPPWDALLASLHTPVAAAPDTLSERVAWLEALQTRREEAERANDALAAELHLIFTCGALRCALSTAWICAALREPLLTPIPGAPERLLGLIAFQGTPLPVFRTDADAAGGVVLILGHPEPAFGWWVSSVEQIVETQTLDAHDAERLSGPALLQDPRFRLELPARTP